jgi:two-component system response regulator YesN
MVRYRPSVGVFFTIGAFSVRPLVPCRIVVAIEIGLLYTAITKEQKMSGMSELLSVRKGPIYSKGSRTTPYRVFLAEDDVATRKSIRDNINLVAAGFEFCSEVPAGEISLPLIQSARPDVLITDIKMPFMDGQQLIRVIRRTMPDIKIIILSRHGEVHYLQEAIKLGVTEYLLKPITPEKLTAALYRVATQLDEDYQARENLQGLKNQVEDSLSMLRGKFLLNVVLGNIPPTEIVEKAHRLKLDMLARAYQVMVVKPELYMGAIHQIGTAKLEHIEKLISQVTQDHTSIISFHKDVDELVLIIKGDSTKQLEQRTYFLARLLKEEVEGQIECLLTIGIGSPKERLGDVTQSFNEAYRNTLSLNGQISLIGLTDRIGSSDTQRLDGTMIEQFLKTGVKADLDAFYESNINPLSKSLLTLPIFLHYFIVGLLITTSRFITKLGGNPDEILAQWQQPEAVISLIHTRQQIKEQTYKFLLAALDFRDNRASAQLQYDEMIHKAQSYIDEHFADAEISLNEVAAYVSMSGSHFSMIFSRETGETFIEYLTRQRIKKARELLRTTNLKAKEIAFEVGYNNQHYFYLVFKKVSGLSPTEFRLTSN